jgi:hypothetical protein
MSFLARSSAIFGALFDGLCLRRFGPNPSPPPLSFPIEGKEFKQDCAVEALGRIKMELDLLGGIAKMVRAWPNAER